MKKIAMQSVQMAVKLVPSSLRESLKRNERLTAFYSQSIRRSGLIYGEPGKRVQKKLYRDFVTRQNQLLSRYVSPPDLPVPQAVILGSDPNDVTVECMRNHGFSPVIKVENAPGTHVQRFNNALASIEAGRPVLLVNGGDTVNAQCYPMLFERLKSEVSGVVYCDTDTNSNPVKAGKPAFCPDWNPELQLSTGYVSTGVLVSPELLTNTNFSASTISALVTELWLTQPGMAIRHVHQVLVYRSNQASHTLEDLQDIAEVLRKHTNAVPALNTEQQVNHVQWPALKEPLVSLIIPTKNGKDLVKACIDSIREKTLYKNYEIILIDNGSDEPESLAYFDELKALNNVTVVEYPGPFNYSAINNFGVRHAKGEIVGLINNDIEVIKPDWLTYMVGHAVRQDIGCVGAKLLYSDGCIQHAGVVLGYGGGAGHAHKYFPRYHPGYMKRLIATQNYSAVTAACLLVKKTIFEQVGGLNEEDLAVAFNDVDFCLRVRETGVRNVYCAEAELYHHESVSRGLDVAPEKAARFNRELAYLRATWDDYIRHDPAYSPNLTLKRENFSIKRKVEFAD